jgi:aspartate racemase
MLQDFYKAKLEEAGIEVLIPGEKDIELINSAIFNELCLGIIKPDSKQEFLKIIKELSLKGAQGAILGCTEIGLLVKQEDTAVPLFDTTLIHAKAAAFAALK